jgi:hypothetical protein
MADGGCWGGRSGPLRSGLEGGAGAIWRCEFNLDHTHTNTAALTNEKEGM